MESKEGVKSGFVYIWFDIKRRMFYVGSHQGAINDGYKTSSTRVKRAISIRPETFRFRVLEHVIFTSRETLLAAETKWLQMIKPQELGNKYYNLKRVAAGGNTLEGMTQERKEEWRKNVSLGGKTAWKVKGRREKMVSTNIFGGNNFSRSYMKTLQYSKAMSDATVGEKNGFFNKIHTEEAREKMRLAKKGKPGNRAKEYILISPDGQQTCVKNMSEYWRNLNAPVIKLSKFLNNNMPIVTKCPQHPLNGWKISHANTNK